MGQWKNFGGNSAHTGGPFRHEKDDYVVEPAKDTIESKTILNFGKYRNQEISAVFENDPGYAKWLYPQEILIGEYPEIKQYLHDKFDGSDLSYTMTWGKHKGKTIKWINDNDKNGYIDWLINNPFVNSNCPKLKKELVELVASIKA